MLQAIPIFLSVSYSLEIGFQSNCRCIDIPCSHIYIESAANIATEFFVNIKSYTSFLPFFMKYHRSQVSINLTRFYFATNMSHVAAHDSCHLVPLYRNIERQSMLSSLEEQYPEKSHGKTSTTVLKASHQKHSSCQLYSNEKNGLQQIQGEICHPFKIVEYKKKKVCRNIFTNGYLTMAS
jgi:hypothetical protein